jgi:hypothetical protein
VEGITNLQVATFAIALLGAVLGLINTWHNLDKKRLKLKVNPMHTIPVGGVDPSLTFGISIVNLSDFPVVVSDAGVLVKETGNSMCIVNPVFANGATGSDWPQRIESRASITVYSQMPKPPEGKNYGLAYANTQCGEMVKGNSNALKQISREHNS